MGEKDEQASASSESSGAPTRPTTISLPPRPYGDAFFNGGGLGFSPGPMTSLVSSFFSDSDDFKSFSQLLAGAMVSPAARSAGGDGGGVDPRFKQNRPAGLAITQASSPMFAFPPELSPGILLDSPSFFGLFSPVQGHHGMTHQQALAQVTAQAAQASPSMHIRPEFPTTNTTASFFPSITTGPHEISTSVPESYELSVSENRSQQLNVDKPADDGYNWRKYGQKSVKGSEFPRSYYKCTSPGCPVKKKVERSLNGQVTEIIYKSQHNHEPPQNNKRGKDGRNLNGRSVNNSSNLDSASQSQTGSLSRYMRENEASQATTEQISEATDSEEVGNAETGMEIDGKDEPDPKRRSLETRVLEPASSHKTVTEPRIIVQTTSEVDLLDDGYRWRKYGQKVVKGNPYPRSYYKCTTPGCNVRKHVERAATDPKAVVTAYEGKHNHDLPAARTSSHSGTANSQLRQQPSNPVNMHHQPIARLRLKEEEIT